MDLIVIIILCVVIALALILFPLMVSRKAEDAAVKKSEWNKIQDYANKINKKMRNNK